MAVFVGFGLRRPALARRSDRPPGDGPAMATVISLIRSDDLSDTAEYAYAVTVPAAARLVYTAGACPLTQDGSTAEVGSCAGRARVCLENLVVSLAAAGA